jgi:azurin/(2Fe-2S) ferredoxin
MMSLRCVFTFLFFLSAWTVLPAGEVFDRGNLAAWCIVPFDAKKRGPEERATMLEKMGVRKFVYDYRAEHIPQWDEELTALKKHGIELFGWWFPTTYNDVAKQTLELFKRHGVKPQLWVNGNGGPVEVKSPEDQKQRIAAEVERLRPICEAAAPLGCQVALYNHGNWYGEPENALAIVEMLKGQGISNVGLVYNLHHGHAHLDRLERLLPKMLPHLLCLNLNGMDVAGDEKGRKILPLGIGTEDVRVLKIIAASGYKGVIGILNHTNEDAEGRLLDNLDGLAWVLPQVASQAAGKKPVYRTWKETAGPAFGKAKFVEVSSVKSVPSLSPEFGKALAGRKVLPGKEAYSKLPLTVECRAKLNSTKGFNILVASEPKSSATHWEIYSYKDSGFFSLYLPGRGGEFKTNVNICDGEWHDLIASIEEHRVCLFVDGKLVLERETVPLTGESVAGGLAFNSLVEGGPVSDGALDDVRLSRGQMKPRKGGLPRQRMDITLDLWDFDNDAFYTEDMSWLLGGKAVPAPAEFKPEGKPLREEEYAHWQADVNRERVFDYYGKQAVQFMGKPLPELLPGFPGLDGGQQGHWGNQNDAVTWRDGRFAASDLGSVFSVVFKGGGVTVPKGVCVRLEDGQSAVFDPLTLSFPLVWSGRFVKLTDSRHGFMGGGVMDGKVVKKYESPKLEAHRYHGFYRHGGRVIFSYTMGDRQYLQSSPDKWEDLSGLTKGGPAQWPEWIETKGVIGKGEPFATDTLTLPFDNPYGTLFFVSGHDFFSDGCAAICTMTGEVWLVRGIDDKLEKLRWKRFATGLHQPLGLKVVKDQIHVLGRDQITRLHDLNGDDEADFYECVTNVQETSPGGHDFITGLEMDAEGRFYTASGNQGIIRIDAGETPGIHEAGETPGRLETGRMPVLQVLATGFRNPNGLGLSPDGKFVTTSVQEGDWTPSSSICQVEIGKNEGAHFGAGGPKDGQPPEPPLMYLPRGEDNSSGGQCFVMGRAWDALKGGGNLTHFSPGTGTGWLVMRQQVEGRWQGAAVRIAGSFDSGSQTGRFHPLDGQLYVTGMQGWGCYAPLDGCFQRVRYTGGQAAVPVGFEARDNGVMLRFDRALEKTAVAKAASHFAQCWNYNCSAAYGSPEMSVKYADTVGHDPLEVRSAQVLEGGKALFLEIPQLVPASMIHLRVAVTKERAHDVFLTAHALAPAFTEFAGYEKIAKTFLPAVKGSAAASSKPNPWAKGERGREIVVDAALGLQYVQKQLTAKAGEKLTLIFKNPDVVPHNWLLARPGTLQKLGDQVNLMITDPKGLAKHYVPDSQNVLVYTDMVNPKGEFSIHFEAPEEKGEYPYLCTFPGHWMVMNGVMKVE